MKTTIALLLILLPPATAVTVIHVGGTEIKIPDPSGFVPVTTEMTKLHDLYQRFVPDQNEGFATFIPAEHVPAALEGEIPPVGRHFSVQTSKNFVDLPVTPDQFAQLKTQVEPQQEKFRQPVREELPAVMRDIDEGKWTHWDIEKALDVVPMLMLRPHRATDRTISYSSFARLDLTDESGDPTHVITAMTTTFILVEGKVLFLFCHADKSDFEWTRQASKEWTEAVLAANS